MPPCAIVYNAVIFHQRNADIYEVTPASNESVDYVREAEHKMSDMIVLDKRSTAEVTPARSQKKWGIDR